MVFSFPSATMTAKRLGATACPVKATRAPLISVPAFTFGLGGAATPTAGTVSISARSIAFDASRLTAPAGKRFDISFDNQDANVPHNVAIYRTSAATNALFRGTIVTGPRSVVYHVPALQPGSYFFRCDVHPQMKGTLVVRGS